MKDKRSRCGNIEPPTGQTIKLMKASCNKSNLWQNLRAQSNKKTVQLRLQNRVIRLLTSMEPKL
jgi:hypothetical protein